MRIEIGFDDGLDRSPDVVRVIVATMRFISMRTLARQ